MPPLALSIPEAAKHLGIGRTTLYRLIGDGVIPVVKIGRRTIVPVASLEALASLS